jgi:hypothetical protein
METKVCPHRSASLPTGVGMEPRLKGTVQPRFPCESIEFSEKVSTLIFATFSYQWGPIGGIKGGREEEGREGKRSVFKIF